jgi:predicted permease
MLNDIRFAARLFRRQSAIMALTVVGLALAIGVNTAAFSFVSTFSLRPIGVPEPASVVEVSPTTSSRGESMWSYSQYLQLRAQTSLMRMEAWYAEGGTFSNTAGVNESVRVRLVSGGFFEAMQGRAAVGRVLQPHDDVVGAQPVVVLSYAFWKLRLGSDAGVIGKTAYFSGTPVVIIGVLERDFTGPSSVDQTPEIWMTLGAANAVYDYLSFSPASDRPVSVVARLQSPAGIEAARAEADAAVATLPQLPAAARSAQPTGVRLSAVVDWASASRYLMSISVMTLVGLVLLLGCANVANLLLAGTTSRQQEIATRLSLGASRGRIVRQLLTESTLLAVIAGALGFLAAQLLLPVIAALIDVPASVEVTADWRVYLYALVASLAVGILAGLAPARHGARGDVITPLKGSARSDRAFKPSRVRAVFLGIQAATSIVLIVLAALFGRAVFHGATQDFGFDPARFIGVAIGMPKGTPVVRLADLRQQAVERVRHLPGVEAVALAEWLPFGRGSRPTTIHADGRRFTYLQNRTSAAYFDTIGLHVVQGRTFTEAEAANHAPVVVISRRVAKDLWGSRDPLGRTLGGAPASRGDPIDLAQARVIGVVEDQTWSQVHRGQAGTIYVPLPDGNASDLLIRTAGEASASARPIQDAVASLDPALRLRRNIIQDSLSRELRPATVLAKLTGALGGLALTLAVVGMFGVTALVVSQRLTEVSIRMAIGATGQDILRLLMRDSLRPVVIGLAAGLVLVLGGGQVLASILYGVSPRDPIAIVMAAAVLVGATSCAVLVPARRAARADPARILRSA